MSIEKNNKVTIVTDDNLGECYSEFYFGENVIQFFSGPDYDYYIDIIGYEEFYKYLVPACEFYVERRHPEHKEIVEQKLKEIREAYGLKKHNFWQNIYKLF